MMLKNKTEFPSIDEWIMAALLPKEVKKIGCLKYYDYYKEKFELCKLHPVTSIVEIGVRYGYSAYSFLRANPSASFVGIDVINGGHGGAMEGIDTFTYVSKMLGKNFPNAKIELIHQNSQKMTEIQGAYDFCHIDGNHRKVCCIHDMSICFSAIDSGGVILVDDYKYIKSVKLAVDEFIEDRASEISNVDIRDSGFRGNAIIVKR